MIERVRRSAFWVLSSITEKLCVFEREHVVDRLTAPDDAPASFVDEHFGRQRTTVVVRCHRRPVRAGVANRHEVAHLEVRQRAIAADDIAAFADRTDDFILPYVER